METQVKHDIESIEDVKVMVDKFYEKVNQDNLLSPIFNDFSNVHWEEHLPKMYQFWNLLLFGVEGYGGRPFPIHATLPITKEHFDRWISLFKSNIDENFVGTIANLAKYKAENIVLTFQYKLGILKY